MVCHSRSLSATPRTLDSMKPPFPAPPSLQQVLISESFLICRWPLQTVAVYIIGPGPECGQGKHGRNVKPPAKQHLAARRARSGVIRVGNDAFVDDRDAPIVVVIPPLLTASVFFQNLFQTLSSSSPSPTFLMRDAKALTNAAYLAGASDNAASSPGLL